MSKDWVGTANSIFKQLGASSHTEEEREENDYYATDPKAVGDLLAVEEFDKDIPIWECASGGGHLVDEFRKRGYKVRSTDLIDRGHQDELLDFLFCFEEWEGHIVTNPPFKFCTEFILKALDLVQDGAKVAMFLKLTTLEGQDRYKKIYQHQPPKRIWVYTKRIQCAKNGIFSGTSAVCYAWFIWEKGYKGPTTVGWIGE